MRVNALNGEWKHPFQIISGWCTLDSRDSSCKCDLSFCSAEEGEISDMLQQAHHRFMHVLHEYKSKAPV